jgi:hypothetical protein
VLVHVFVLDVELELVPLFVVDVELELVLVPSRSVALCRTDAIRRERAPIN